MSPSGFLRLCLCCPPGSVRPLVHLSIDAAGALGSYVPCSTAELSLVLVCLSADVTGTLVPLNSVCFARFFLLFAPPFFCPPVASPYSGPAQCASLLLCLCCSLSPCLSFGCLLVLPGGACVFVLSLAPRARCLCWFVLLAVLVWASVFPGLPALPCCASCLCLSSSPAPRVIFFLLWSSSLSCVLVPPSEYLVAAVTALLPCFLAGSVVLLCFPSVIRFMATKASCPVWGVHPLHHVIGGVGELSSAILRHSP